MQIYKKSYQIADCNFNAVAKQHAFIVGHIFKMYLNEVKKLF